MNSPVVSSLIEETSVSIATLLALIRTRFFGLYLRLANKGHTFASVGGNMVRTFCAVRCETSAAHFMFR